MKYQLFIRYFYEQISINLIFDGFNTRKKRFHLVSDFFRAQPYLTKISPRVVKHGSLVVEVEWSMDIIKCP